MTVTQPSQDPNKDSATLVWEGEATNAINTMQHQIDNINQTVVTSTPRVAIYSHTSDGAVQSFTPPASGDGYVSYFAYTDELPTLPVSGITFSAFSDDEIDFKIRQYIERAAKPVNPGAVTYNVANGSWLSSSNWTKTKLVRGATNVWYCEAHIVGTTGSITTKWGNPKLLYGGQTGSGILYYTTAAISGSAPGKPLADGYDFESGAFTNLRNAGQAIGGTNNWQYSPISVAVGGGTVYNALHWQCTFNVEVSELTEHTTLLSAVLNAGATTVTVDSTAGFPIPSTNNTPLTIYIGSEQITYTGVTNTTFTGCVRGANSTSDVEHANDSVVTTRLPVQVITFGTPTGFQPVSTNLQSDNFVAGNAGWQIIRGGTNDGDAEFSNVTIRGNSTVAGSLVAGALTAATIGADEITAGTIDASSITLNNLDANNITTGNLTATNVAFGVILQAMSGARSYSQNEGSGGGGNVFTFTSTDNDNFSTKAIFIITTFATSGDSDDSTEDQCSTTIQLTGSGIDATGSSCSVSYSSQRNFNTTMHTLDIGKGIAFSMDLSCTMERVATGGGYAQLLEVKI